MPRLTRKESREQTRAAVLAAARAVFTEKGFGAATVEEIAERAGYSRGAVYSNFADKEELFLALMEQHWATQESALREDIESTASINELLNRLSRRSRGRSGEVRAWFLLSTEFALHAIRTRNVRRRLAERERKIRSALASEVVSLISDLDIELDASPELLASIVIALDEGLLLQHFVDPKQVKIDAYIDALEALIRAARKGA